MTRYTKGRVLLRKTIAAKQITPRKIDIRRAKGNEAQRRTKGGVHEVTEEKNIKKVRTETTEKDPPVPKPTRKIKRPLKHDGRANGHTANRPFSLNATRMPVYPGDQRAESKIGITKNGQTLSSEQRNEGPADYI